MIQHLLLQLCNWGCFDLGCLYLYFDITLGSFGEYSFSHTLVHAITNHCWNAIPENEITCLLVLWEGSSWMVDRTLDWESGDPGPGWPWHRFPRVAYLLWPQCLHLKVRCWTTSNLSFDIQRIYNIKLFSMSLFARQEFPECLLSNPKCMSLQRWTWKLS